MVIWLVGLSGSGKTTLGRHLYHQWKAIAANTVMVDGDEIRQAFALNGIPQDYTLEGRRANNERIAQLCHWLDRQEINVVCCILNVFPERLTWNRSNYSQYFEVSLSVPLDVLAARDIKQLYAPAMAGQCGNVVGVDIPYAPPLSPDMTIDTSIEGADHAAQAAAILRAAGICP